MAYLSALNDILSVRNGVWSLVALFALALWHGWKGLPAVMQQWIAGRQQRAAEEVAKRKAAAEEKAADWDRLREEVSRLAERHDECERNLATEREARHLAVSQLRDEVATERAERMKLQAILDGHGEVKQAAAVAAAEARRDEAEKTRRADKSP